jgi:hypothetical protein
MGIAAGAAVGAPSAIERAALGAIGRVEQRFGVALDAERVDWTWGGRVEVSGLSAKTGGEVFATASRVVFDADIDWAGRRVRLATVTLDDAALRLHRRPDGTTNVDTILAGLERRSQGGSGVAGVTLDPSWPEVRGQGARIVIDHGFDKLPLGLTLPGRIELRQGQVGLRSDGDRAVLAATFADSSLDPGEGLTVELEVDRAEAGRRILDKVSLRPSRPVRFWLGQRVVGLGGVALGSAGLEFGPLQLSVPVAVANEAVSAAATVERVVLDTDAPLALARSLAQPATVREALARITRVTVVKPVIAVALEAGRHGFEDLLEALHTAPTADAQAAPDFVEVVSRAALEASEKLLGAASPIATAPRVPLPVRVRRVAEGLERLRGDLLAQASRAISAIPIERLGVEGGELLVSVDQSELSFRDLGLSLERLDGARTLTMKGALDAGGTTGRLGASLTLGADTLSGTLSAEHVALGPWLARVPALGRLLRGASPLIKSGSVASLALNFTAPTTLDRLELEGKGRLEDLAFAHPAIAADPMRLRALEGSGRLRWVPAEGHLVLEEGLLSSNDVAVAAVADLGDAFGTPRLRLSLALPETPAQRLFQALPEGFAPALEGLAIEGTVSWKVDAEVDFSNLKSIKVDSVPSARDLRVASMGAKVDFDRLRNSHTYGIRLADETPGERVVGPATGSWIPLSQISPHLPAALTTTEDGTFYTNDGISTFAMKESLATNLERGSFVRGASTITQQLVKNLFLGGRKTISRKLQEIFIAWQMAQHLSKDEVMALYLNTIEFGPGIYGLGDAAWHWFGKRPLDLTLAEAVFLASIVPGPRRYYSFFQQGAITPRWRDYLTSLIRIMVERKKITPEEQAAVLPVDVKFRGAGGGYTDAVPEGFDAIPERDDLGDEDEPDPR